MSSNWIVAIVMMNVVLWANIISICILTRRVRKLEEDVAILRGEYKLLCESQRTIMVRHIECEESQDRINKDFAEAIRRVTDMNGKK